MEVAAHAVTVRRRSKSAVLCKRPPPPPPLPRHCTCVTHDHCATQYRKLKRSARVSVGRVGTNKHLRADCEQPTARASAFSESACAPSGWSATLLPGTASTRARTSQDATVSETRQRTNVYDVRVCVSDSSARALGACRVGCFPLPPCDALPRFRVIFRLAYLYRVRWCCNSRSAQWRKTRALSPPLHTCHAPPPHFC